MHRNSFSQITAFGFTVVAILFSPKHSLAQSDHYSGKSIKIIVSSSAGGGTDTAARLVASLMPRYIPGNPNFIVQNMAGAGGRVANNFFSREAKPDGLTLLQGDTNSLSSFTRGGSSVNYDPRKYEAIGAIVRGGSLVAVRKDALGRLNSRSTNPVIAGDIDGITSWVAMAVWGAEYLGWNLRFIHGYRGTQETALALRRGEIGVWGTTNAQTLRELVKEDLIDVLAQQDETRRSDFSQIPTFNELLGNKRPHGAAWEAYNAWAGPTSVDKFLAAPAGTPKEITNVLRQAFDRMIREDQFKTQATTFFGEGWHILSGEKVGNVIREVTTISPDAQAYLSKVRKKYNLPQGTGD